MNTSKKQKHYIIYQTTNLVNNKIYIGKHITENIEDQYFGSGKYLQNAIKKYGIENFEFKILIDLNNEEEMNLLEKYVVTQEFCDREDTYNINVGGDGGWSYVNNRSEYQTSNKRKQAQIKGGKIAMKNMLDKNQSPLKIYLSRLSIDEKNNYFKQCIDCLNMWRKNNPDSFIGKNNPMYGHIYTEETRKRLSESQTGSKNSQYGTMWICNDLTKENRKIKKTDLIPEGWRKGRIC